MKKTSLIFLVILNILASQSILLVKGSTEWSGTVSTTSYHWKTSSSQFSKVGLYLDIDPKLTHNRSL
ncbi:hypothetical protein LCGC14_0730170 [marine sediment metagenome]|uniref:Uncharacterized protein n=1 Tax=marine sediment metagenome TaxID=412755 RepID=A0A0F9QUT0_9ZZZZ